MFVRYSHHNVRSFSASVSTTEAIFSATVSGAAAMFVRRHRYVFALSFFTINATEALKMRLER